MRPFQQDSIQTCTWDQVRKAIQLALANHQGEVMVAEPAPESKPGSVSQVAQLVLSDDVVLLSIECDDAPHSLTRALTEALDPELQSDLPMANRLRVIQTGETERDTTTIRLALRTTLVQLVRQRPVVLLVTGCAGLSPQSQALFTELVSITETEPLVLVLDADPLSVAAQSASRELSTATEEGNRRAQDTDPPASLPIEELLKQSRDLRIQGIPEQAMHLFGEFSFDKCTPDEVRQVLIERGTVKEQIGDASCVDDFRELITLNTTIDPQDILRVTRSYFQLGMVDQALAFLDLYRNDPATTAPNRSVLDVAWGTVARFNLESRDRAKESLNSGLVQLEQGENLGALGVGLLSELAFERVAKVEYGVDAVDKILASAEANLNFDDIQSLSWFWCAYTAHLAGFNMRSITILNQVIKSARQYGLRTQYVQALALRSGPLFHLGYLDEASADAEIAIAAAQSPQQYIVPSTRGTLVQLRTWMNESKGARALIAEQDQLGWSATGADMLFLYGKAIEQFHNTQISGCIQSLLEASKLQELGEGDNPAMIPWASLKAEAHAANSEWDLAEQCAADELDRAQQFGSPGPTGIALRAVAIASPTPDVDLLRESVRHHELGERKVEHVQALISLGSALVDGYPTDARPILRDALGLAHTFKARKLAHDARRLLIASGGRPRREAVLGTESLTPSEHRVLALICEKMTNPEIAEHLFITRKAVEWHLTKAYRKLEVNGRNEAREAYRARRSPKPSIDLA